VHRARLYEAVGAILVGQGQTLAGSRYLGRAFLLDPNPARGVALARTQTALGRGRGALDTIQRAVAGRVPIRLDANQGYDRDDALRFVAGLDPAGIELFEQPCAAGDWESAVAVARVAPVPMMLDESIYGLAEVDRAAELKAAAYIKFKLMKAGGLTRLADALGHIRAMGMEPVLGNGVAHEVGCWMEACVARSGIRNAGEMNGFLKPRDRILARPLAFTDGALVLEPGFIPTLDAAAVARLAIATETVSA